MSIFYNNSLIGSQDGFGVSLGGIMFGAGIYYSKSKIKQPVIYVINNEETIRTVISNATVEYTVMQYLDVYHPYTIKANALTATIEYTDVTIVNP